MSLKTVFSYQVSPYDCVPITFINALAYLFDRDDIPPLVIQKIYQYSLDTITEDGELGHGTTGLAIALLGNWLKKYQTDDFSVRTTYLDRERVSLDEGSMLLSCLDNGGCALLRIHTGQNQWHYILVLSVDNQWLYAFDPCRRSQRVLVSGAVEYFPHASEQEPNLRIRRDWLQHWTPRKRFALGENRERECLLIEAAVN